MTISVRDGYILCRNSNSSLSIFDSLVQFALCAFFSFAISLLRFNRSTLRIRTAGVLLQLVDALVWQTSVQQLLFGMSHATDLGTSALRRQLRLDYQHKEPHRKQRRFRAHTCSAGEALTVLSQKTTGILLSLTPSITARTCCGVPI